MTGNKRSAGYEEKIAQAVEPVGRSLLETAQRQADKILSEAEGESRALLERARADADLQICEARSAGAATGDDIAASRVAAARRRAHTTVLLARGQAYETLRSEAVAELVRRAETSEGRALVRSLTSLAGQRFEGTPTFGGSDPGALIVEAKCGNRRAVIEPEMLVDHVLESMSGEVEILWR